MIPFAFVLIVLAGGPVSTQPVSAQVTQPGHLGPSCKKVPDLEWAGKTVEQVKAAADLKWGTGKWDIVVVQAYDDAKYLPVVAQHPYQERGLTAGELMHLYVDGSGGYLDTTAERVTVVFLGGLALFLGWRLWKKK
jgi:hypothetical protein